MKTAVIQKQLAKKDFSNKTGSLSLKDLPVI